MGSPATMIKSQLIALETAYNYRCIENEYIILQYCMIHGYEKAYLELTKTQSLKVNQLGMLYTRLIPKMHEGVQYYTYMYMYRNMSRKKYL